MKRPIKFVRSSFYRLRLYKLHLFRTFYIARFKNAEKALPEPPITVCIPAFKSESWIHETFRSLESQTFQHFNVLISIDGYDLDTFEKCRPLLNNSRYKVHLQTKRLGWVGNTNWLLANASTPFVSILPHDDLFHPFYLEVLYKHLLAHPKCLLVYSDTQMIGSDPSFKGRYFIQSSLKGAPIQRMQKYLLRHLNAAGFRGLIVKEALELSGLIPENQPDHFAADTIWIGKIAKQGEIHRIPVPLCTKRYHANNTHMKWFKKTKEEQKIAWQTSCEALLAEFLKQVNDPIHQEKLREATAFRFEQGCLKFGL